MSLADPWKNSSQKHFRLKFQSENKRLAPKRFRKIQTLLVFSPIPCSSWFHCAFDAEHGGCSCRPLAVWHTPTALRPLKMWPPKKLSKWHEKMNQSWMDRIGDKTIRSYFAFQLDHLCCELMLWLRKIMRNNLALNDELLFIPTTSRRQLRWNVCLWSVFSTIHFIQSQCSLTATVHTLFSAILASVLFWRTLVVFIRLEHS